MEQKEQFYGGTLRERLDRKFEVKNQDSKYANKKLAKYFLGSQFYRVFDQVCRFVVRPTGPKMTIGEIEQRLIDIGLAKDREDTKSLLDDLLNTIFPIYGLGILNPNKEFEFFEASPSRKGETRYRVKFLGDIPAI